MAYVTVEMLCEYTGKYPDDDAALPQVYLDSAVETVSRYLRYNPEAASYTVSVWGDGTDQLVLPAPVESIESVIIGGESVALEQCTFKKNYLARRLSNGLRQIFSTDQKIDITFTGGFTAVPNKIVTTTLQVAALYWESAGGNLAVSSTSYVDLGSRTYNNFQESRFLDQLNEWRIYNV